MEKFAKFNRGLKIVSVIAIGFGFGLAIGFGSVSALAFSVVGVIGVVATTKIEKESF